MDEIASTQDTNELQSQYRALQRQFQTLLVLCILISGTLSLFLLRQYREAKGAVEGASSMFNQYTNVAPAMDDFARRAVEYSRTHPDFAQLLAKYGLSPANFPPSGAAPAPGAPRR
jgi:hypothetical protein